METKERVEGRRLVDLVFSWSLQDVRNRNFYKGQVEKIPQKCSSLMDYFKSFVPPLIEETHADLFSSMTTLWQAPTCEIVYVERSKNYKAPSDLFYKISVTGLKDDAARNQLESGDLIAVADIRPKCIDELKGSERPYLLALVYGVDHAHPNTFKIYSSKPIIFVEDMQKKIQKLKRGSLFGVRLINMTTNIRIWKALHPDSQSGNLKLIQRVLQGGSGVEGGCVSCLSEADHNVVLRGVFSKVRSYKLNSSQENAVLNCLKTRKCLHCHSINLIWGPPGTGKTKTISVLLFALHKMRCRTVTCAPTNVAVLEVASRLVRLVLESSKCDTYGLGDILLFGNGERMKIDDRDDLLDVFLDYRVDILYQCFRPLVGWRASIVSMIQLLENPEGQYNQYLESKMQAHNEEDKTRDQKKDNDIISPSEKNDQGRKEEKVRKVWKQVVSQALKENSGKRQQNMTKESHLRRKDKQDQISNHKMENNDDVTIEEEQPLSFEEFLEERFSCLRQRLEIYVVNLYTHLPTSFISFKVVEKMTRTFDMLRGAELSSGVSGTFDKGLKSILADFKKGKDKSCHYTKHRATLKECLEMLNSLPKTFGLPDFIDMYAMRKFCLENACLLFCTASSSSKLHTPTMKPIELLVIDEAAQLKECESTIPLQLPGLTHAILIGDERQLPAMVQSKIASEAEFGRSLFERLVLLGQEKHLLNMQYRMHPWISIFPNKEFYDMKILDAQPVGLRSYKKHFLPGKMYGPYSFINISCGKEQSGEGHSLKNLVEVAVVSEIIASLSKVSDKTGTKISVGVISPYKAQVLAIQDKIGHTYSTSPGGSFSVSVRSVDGFQGGEEDVIIMSTVRCNGNGSVGFLSNQQRANVALTRARHCLWILGNEATLFNSNSIWRKLVVDAKNRGCFHNAVDDKNLAQTITNALLEFDQLDKLLNKQRMSFKDAKWKVCFTDEFHKSVARIMDREMYKEILTLLEKLSHGWRQRLNEKNILIPGGTSSQLLEQYPINDVLDLIWAVDILKESSHCIQVLKVWDVLPSSDVPELAKRLDIVYGKYTVVKINGCKARRIEGDLVVPLRWPIEYDGAFHEDGKEDDPVSGLSKSFASISLTKQKAIPTEPRKLRKSKKKHIEPKK